LALVSDEILEFELSFSVKLCLKCRFQQKDTGSPIGQGLG